MLLQKLFSASARPFRSQQVATPSTRFASVMTEGRIAEILYTLRGRSLFFRRRCLAGFPWFWPARPLGQHAMVEARRMVRRHFGRDHHPVHRKLAQVLVTIAWPPAVLLNLWQVREGSGDGRAKS